jgi:hypothetical protein
LDTFENYFGSSSRFADTKEGIWTTTITISHWSIRPTTLGEYGKYRMDSSTEKRKSGKFPPPNIANLGQRSIEEDALGHDEPVNIAEERSTSLVITGDMHGFFWICSIWSSLTKHNPLAVHISTLAPIMRMFIHQRVTGRCLVFLIILGHFCEMLATEYEIIIRRLNTVVDLGVSYPSSQHMNG